MAKKRNNKFLWTNKEPEMLQFWPTCDKEISLTKPFLPKEIVNTNRYPFVIAPEPQNFDPLNATGIEFAAFTEHSDEYISDHSKKLFTSILYTISGRAKLKTADKIFTLTKGTALLSPSKTDSELRVEKRWSVLWFHIRHSEYFSQMHFKSAVFKNSERFNELVKTAENYKTEVYKKDRNNLILELLAKTMIAYIKSDFPNGDLYRTQIENCANNFLNSKNSIVVAKELGITVYELDKISKKIFGETFAKTIFNKRMNHARLLLETTQMRIIEIARLVGFANNQSFTKAFTKFYKTTPNKVRDR